MKLLWAIIVSIVLYILIKRLVTHIQNKIIADSIEHNKYTIRIAHLVGMVIFIVLMLFTVLIFFEIIGFSTALLMGWFAIAIGFAMETTIGNMVAGIILITNKKIQVGKSFKFLGNINEIATVQEFHIRYTVLKNLYKQRIIVPNMTLLRTPIQTKKTERLARWELRINLSRHYNLDIVRDRIISTINAHEKILHHKQTTVIIESFTAKGYELVCYYYYSPLLGKKVDFIINGELRSAIKKTLAQHGIKLSYNRQIIHIDPELF
jgi:small-conductance mechanosensitive channel